VLVEHQQRLEDLEGVRVCRLLADLLVQFRVRERLLSLEALEREGRSELGRLVRGGVY
jgi:hypothetical protein